MPRLSARASLSPSSRVVLIAHLAAGHRRGFLGVFTCSNYVSAKARGLYDLVVVSSNSVAVAFEHLQFVPQGLYVATHVAGVSPLRHELERDLLSATPNPEARVRLLHTLGLVDRLVYRVVFALELRVVLRPHSVE